MYHIHHLSKVRVNYVLGAKWLAGAQLLADSTSAFRVSLSTGYRFRAEDLLSLATQRDRHQQGTGVIRCQCWSLRIGREYRSVAPSDRDLT
jgi:hypothetical protein